MPLWDTRCTVCGTDADDRIVWHDTLPPCASCGGPTQKRYAHMPVIHQDTIPGGQWIEHAGPEPRFVESKSERRRYLKEMGVREKVRHIGMDGTDKSRHTTRWTCAPVISEDQRRAEWHAHEATLQAALAKC